MRLSLGAIEAALANPAAYRAGVEAGDGGGFGYTYANALRNGIYRYHSTMDRDAASEYLDESIRRSKKLKSTQRRIETLEQLDWYMDQHAALNWPTFDTRLRVKVPVPARAADSLTCTGEVGRVDLVPSGGYAGWLFVSTLGTNWQQELRMPLLQGVLAAEILNVATEEVQVGIYDFGGRQAVRTRFDDTTVRRARRRFSRLVTDMGF
jgi:hypothetical protein